MVTKKILNLEKRCVNILKKELIMANLKKFKRLCVDTNIIMDLALLYFRGETEFIDTNVAGKGNIFNIKQYAEDIANLQKYIEKHAVEIVLVPQVMYELNYRDKEVDKNGNKVELGKLEIARQKRKELALEYLKIIPEIKIAKILPDREQIFYQYSERLANEYVHSFHIFAPNKQNNLPSDALIMAQVTALGIDFLTRDNHFKRTHYLSDKSRAEKIYMTNNNMGGRTTKLIEISELDYILNNRNGSKVYPKRYFKENVPLVNCEYITYDDYLTSKPAKKAPKAPDFSI